MDIWGYIFTIGIFLGPIIYLILSYIGDSISDYVEAAKRKKYYGTTQRKRANSTNRTNSNNQKEKTAFNENGSSEILSFYRSLLGLKLQFTQAELKEAYRKAVAKYHPDRYGTSDPRNRENAEMLMKQVNEAYERLKKAA